MVQVRVKFYGIVQGVFFRANTKRKAREMGINGYVRNMPDGSVEAVFEGDEKNTLDNAVKFNPYLNHVSE